jgi:meiotically up-regulated gene 157 (Mug157) protein|tara:strand:- start:789 stop:1043 length:255 start_codon:yes stop_codon:yes gene_type:complete
MNNMFKEAIKALKIIAKSAESKSMNLSDMCIHMESADGQVWEIDYEIDELTGGITKEFNYFENEDDYQFFLEHEGDDLEGIVYN